jgi:hypothetical protein
VRVTPYSLLLVLLTSSLLGCKEDAPWVPEVVVSVDVQADHCRVKEVTLSCASVADHLRNRLGLLTDTPIQVSCIPPTSASCDMDSVMRLLTSSGYTNLLGYVEIDSTKQ